MHPASSPGGCNAAVLLWVALYLGCHAPTAGGYELVVTEKWSGGQCSLYLDAPNRDAAMEESIRRATKGIGATVGVTDTFCDPGSVGLRVTIMGVTQEGIQSLPSPMDIGDAVAADLELRHTAAPYTAVASSLRDKGVLRPHFTIQVVGCPNTNALSTSLDARGVCTVLSCRSGFVITADTRGCEASAISSGRPGVDMEVVIIGLAAAVGFVMLGVLVIVCFRSDSKGKGAKQGGAGKGDGVCGDLENNTHDGTRTSSDHSSHDLLHPHGPPSAATSETLPGTRQPTIASPWGGYNAQGQRTTLPQIPTHSKPVYSYDGVRTNPCDQLVDSTGGYIDVAV